MGAADLATPGTIMAIGLILLLAGLWLLRWSWLAGRGARRELMVGGWLSVGGGFIAFGCAFGAEVGIAYALVAFSLLAYVCVVATMEVRARRDGAAREAAPVPEQRKTGWGRAIFASLLAIVLSGVAAIGLGVAFAVAMPLPATDRIVVGGLLVPVLWGGGMAWTLADGKLVRAAVILIGFSAVGYGIAFLPKMVL